MTASRHYLLLARRGFGLGDVVMLTGLARDIALQHPGRYDVGVDTNFRPVWDNNPHVTVRSARDRGAHRQVVAIDYAQAIRDSRSGVRRHFLNAFYADFSKKTGVPVWPSAPHGDLHLSDDELRPAVGGRYWLLLAGGKADMTVKIWDSSGYQGVVNLLRERGITCVQAGTRERSHFHEPLAGCVDMVGKTPGVRGLLSLVRHADGVICGITSAMHIAACFSKPCVVIAGGREEPWFVAYANAYPEAFDKRCRPVAVPHKFLHTVGLLDCCSERGCWKKKTIPVDYRDSTAKGRSRLCLNVTEIDGRATPTCMAAITPEHVVAAVADYYEEGMIPPIEMKTAAPPPIARPVAPAPPDRLAGRVRHPVFDHPLVGGKFTVFVLCYGDHTGLARRCIDSVLNSVPIDRIDLRVICNAVAPATLSYLGDQPVSRLYVHAENKFKYPTMREAFRDQAAPIVGNYAVWFDDDSYVADARWLEKLGQAIIDNHPHGCRLFGWKHFHDLRPYLRGGHEPRDWFRAAPWCRNKNLRVRSTDRRAPNGTCVDFVVGSFWALHKDVIVEADVPDARLCHNGGDITIGEQVTQAGYKICNFNQGKKIVLCSMAPRRGYQEKFPWANM